jgi:hypothetical protein
MQYLATLVLELPPINPICSWLCVADFHLEIFVFGFGRHTFNVDPNHVAPGLFLYWLDEIAYQILMLLVKGSILLFYVSFHSKISTENFLTLQAEAVSRPTFQSGMLYHACIHYYGRSCL